MNMSASDRRRRFSSHVRTMKMLLDAGRIDEGMRCCADYPGYMDDEGDIVFNRWIDLAAEQLEKPPFLHVGEREFLRTVISRWIHLGTVPTEKQQAWLAKIAERPRRVRPRR